MGTRNLMHEYKKKLVEKGVPRAEVPGNTITKKKAEAWIKPKEQKPIAPPSPVCHQDDLLTRELRNHIADVINVPSPVRLVSTETNYVDIPRTTSIQPRFVEPGAIPETDILTVDRIRLEEKYISQYADLKQTEIMKIMAEAMAHAIEKDLEQMLMVSPQVVMVHPIDLDTCYDAHRAAYRITARYRVGQTEVY